jgi:hypothetical protein
MPIFEFIWDESGDGNVAHLAEHGVTPQEAAFVVEHGESRATSRSTGLPVVFGYTPAKRFLMVVYEVVAEDTVYVHTGYEVPPITRRK